MFARSTELSLYPRTFGSMKNKVRHIAVELIENTGAGFHVPGSVRAVGFAISWSALLKEDTESLLICLISTP
ncbi:hypothetical protein MSMTP_0239 [Methanosarcina sp. MTP4]|uniref:hypothetical protein n=1 Tax=Methanosarcina sp. MTP4 TaxID=1434100 RepID=UPI000615CA8A|nr:hypothetical protein [Methanosarcina sp. MTP4]AKB23708.1 hypothetical protein MSMTP_0239 [Methanosarcina sp. MTP4]